MPTTGAIIWASISGLILLMLGIIGYLISTGFSGLRYELQKLWEKIDNHQTAAEKNALAIAEINARCDERHHTRSGEDRRKP